jgi:sterol-4alpha-carboxylate 3-dehydrogenase (decarboxylating)
MTSPLKLSPTRLTVDLWPDLPNAKSSPDAFADQHRALPPKFFQTQTLSVCKVPKTPKSTESPLMTSQTPKPISLGTVLVIGGCGFLGHNIVNQLLNYPLESQTPNASYSSSSNNHANGVAKDEKNRKQLRTSLDEANGPAPSPSAYPPLKGRYPPLINTAVHVLDISTSRNVLPGATYYAGDITSASEVLEVFKKVKPDVVIHTASPPMVDGRKEMWRRVNVEGTRTLLEVAGGGVGDWSGKCRAFVYTSSASVVHDSVSELIDRDETWPYVRGEEQKEYYSDTKVCAWPLRLRELGLRG